MSITPKNGPHVCILLLAIFSMLFAYFVEYIMSLAVCPLCVYQRFPYLILFMIALTGLSSNRKLTSFYLVTILTSILLAGYHTGVERGIFALSSVCKPLMHVSDNLSIVDFKKMLYNDQMGMCNKPALVIFGLSMTEWNLLLNITLFAILIKQKIK
ncbi:MAG: disulfide bond formation protein B [Rickettsiaceae bacterium]